jgi:hypothetical protein
MLAIKKPKLNVIFPRTVFSARNYTIRKIFIVFETCFQHGRYICDEVGGKIIVTLCCVVTCGASSLAAVGNICICNHQSQ